MAQPSSTTLISGPSQLINSTGPAIAASTSSGSGVGSPIEITTGNSLNGGAAGLKHQALNSGSSSSSATLASAAAAAAASKDVISPAVVAAVAAAGYDSADSDFEHHIAGSNRSRQKKFFKNFKHLPQEEVVLQSKCSSRYLLLWPWMFGKLLLLYYRTYRSGDKMICNALNYFTRQCIIHVLK